MGSPTIDWTFRAQSVNSQPHHVFSNSVYQIDQDLLSRSTDRGPHTVGIDDETETKDLPLAKNYHAPIYKDKDNKIIEHEDEPAPMVPMADRLSEHGLYEIFS